MEHKIYILGDVEMGRGDIMDDFSDDYILVDFIEKITTSKHTEKVTLVLLGDIFDFLKMSYKGLYPRYITEEISLWKLDEIIMNHNAVFRALKTFLDNKNCDIEFVIGNHDPDLVWAAVQNRLLETLRHRDRVKFGFKYTSKTIHAEHGHLVDPFFHINTRRPIIRHKGREILNLPFGAHACFTHLVNIKKKFPREESLYPNPVALEMNEEYKKMSKKATMDLILKSLIIQPLLHPLDPTYRAPYLPLLMHGLKYGLNVIDDEKFVQDRLKQLIRQNPGKQIYVMAHAHVLSDLKINDKRAFVTDTWRDEYDLNNEERKKPKSYVEISCKNDKLNSAELKLINQ